MHKNKLLAIALSVVLFDATALPAGSKLVSGNVNFLEDGNTLIINQDSPSSLTEWDNFSVGNKETVDFKFSDESQLSVNKVITDAISVINGKITSNANLVLINQNGIAITKRGIIDSPGLLLTSYDYNQSDNKINLNSTPSSGAISNHGILRAKNIALVSPYILNFGSITGYYSNIQLNNHKKVTIDFNGDNFI